jgi:limonene-1,2-epoxide hydrolase
MNDIAASDADLELALDEEAIQAHLSGLFAHDFDKAHRVYRKDAVLTQPQLGATVVGRDNIMAARRKRASQELVNVDVVLGQGDLWVAECIFTEGAKKFMVVNVMEFCDGQIVQEREYTCDLSGTP